MKRLRNALAATGRAIAHGFGWSVRMLGLGIQRLGLALRSFGVVTQKAGQSMDPIAPSMCACGNPVAHGLEFSPHRIGTVWRTNKKTKAVAEMALFCDGSER